MKFRNKSDSEESDVIEESDEEDKAPIVRRSRESMKRPNDDSKRSKSNEQEIPRARSSLYNNDSKPGKHREQEVSRARSNAPVASSHTGRDKNASSRDRVNYIFLIKEHSIYNCLIF